MKYCVIEAWNKEEAKKRLRMGEKQYIVGVYDNLEEAEYNRYIVNCVCQILNIEDYGVGI